MSRHPTFKRFYLQRFRDSSGVSGTGIIAYGVILPSNRVVMEWATKYRSIAIYESLNEIQYLHAKSEETSIVFY